MSAAGQFRLSPLAIGLSSFHAPLLPEIVPTSPSHFSCSIVLRVAIAIILLGSISAGRAQKNTAAGADDLAIIYNSAMQAFQQGNWQSAADGLEKLIAAVTDEKAQAQLAPVYYQLGAAYFNMPNYAKAVETFKKYVSKFPNAERIWEVKLGLAQSLLANKSFDEAVRAFEELEKVPAYREQSLMAQVQALKEQNKPDEAIRVLEKLVPTDIKSTNQASGAILLAQFYAEKEQPQKALEVIDRLKRKIHFVENLVSMNSIIIKLADEFREQKLYKEAIAAYRAVRSRAEVIRLQNERIAYMEKRMSDNLRAATGNPQLFAQMSQTNTIIKTAQTEAKTLLTEFEKLPDYAPALLMRVAQCWADWEKKWESVVVYNRLIDRYPKAEEREQALFAVVMTYADLNLAKRTQELCQQYLKEYPSGTNAATVGYISGAVALQVNDPQSAEQFFGMMLETQPNSTYKEQMRFLLGNARFMQGKYEEALKDYRKYLEDYPQGESAEDVTYRVAVSTLFAGRFEDAIPLLNGYLQKYPEGPYAADAKYRLAVCKYAAQQYEAVVAECQAWLKEFAANQQEGEVRALLGDALAAQNKLAEAIPHYVRSYKTATTDEVLNYSLFEASKHMQKLGQWSEVGKMFEEFVNEKPDHAAVVAAMYWIGKARAREGKVNEAKQFLVENIKKYIEEPKREAVEQLLTQLAQLCSKRPRPAPGSTAAASTDAASGAAVVPTAAAQTAPAPTASASAVPAAEPSAPPPYDAYAELDKQLEPLADTSSPTAKARLLFARAEMATIKRQPAEREKIFREIAERFKPEDLSPVLLAQVGDFLFEKGEVARAAALYTRLKEDFPKSDYVDYGYVGLGEIAFQNKEYEKALELFTDGLEKVAAAMKVKEATLGRAKTLMEIGTAAMTAGSSDDGKAKLAEARKLFEQVASVREWRGDSTAYAVYALGEIEARQGRWPEAIAHFRRVFVAYQKYVPWVAKSYLRAAESFDKMGKRKDAIDNLREMLRNEKLQARPEIEEARRRLQEWGAA